MKGHVAYKTFALCDARNIPKLKITTRGQLGGQRLFEMACGRLHHIYTICVSYIIIIHVFMSINCFSDCDYDITS